MMNVKLTLQNSKKSKNKKCKKKTAIRKPRQQPSI